MGTLQVYALTRINPQLTALTKENEEVKNRNLRKIITVITGLLLFNAVITGVLTENKRSKSQYSC